MKTTIKNNKIRPPRNYWHYFRRYEMKSRNFLIVFYFIVGFISVAFITSITGGTFQDILFTLIACTIVSVWYLLGSYIRYRQEKQNGYSRWNAVMERGD